MTSSNQTLINLKKSAILEASAGTGKTYTIANLYLNLLTGRTNYDLSQKEIDNNDVRNEPLNIDEILIVTFTEDATAELKDRLRRRIKKAYNEEQDPNIKLKLQQAIFRFDEALIMTIHGFCLRYLSDFAYECGISFNPEITADESEITNNAIVDLYRRFIQGDISPYINTSELKEKFDAYVQYCDFVAEGKTDKQDLEELHQILRENVKFSKSTINKTLRDCSLVNLLKEFFFLAMPEFDKLSKYYQQNKNVKINNDDDDEKEKFILNQLIEEELINHDLVNKEKEDKSILTFDDILILFEKALQNQEKLCKTLGGQLKVAIIDEFQDTDNIQWNIFSKIFIENHSNNIIVVGDPKQAIYAFRGGDIDVYTKARNEVEGMNQENRFTLDTNWRSVPGMVKATNKVFNNPRAFLSESITFSPVKWATKKNFSLLADNTNNSHKLFINNELTNKETPIQDHCLVFSELIIRDGEKLDKAAKENNIYNRTIIDIIDLLNNEKNEIIEIQNYKIKESRCVLPKDIAILVRTNEQAKYFKKLLSRYGIPAVLQSDSDVFASQEAKDIYTLLYAVMNSKKTNLVRAVLNTKFLNFTPQEIFDTHEIHGTKEKQQWFYEFQVDLLNFSNIASSLGFFAVINQFIDKYNSLSKILKDIDGERVITNIKQVSEIINNHMKENHLDCQTTLQWLKKEILEAKENKAKSENQKVRLESDNKALTITTIHKSKGLEYNITFIPFLWTENKYATLEQLPENARLFYVAMTRAKHRTYLYYTTHNKTQKVQEKNYLSQAITSNPDLFKNEATIKTIQFYINQDMSTLGVYNLPNDNKNIEIIEPAEINSISDNFSVRSFSGIARNLHNESKVNIDISPNDYDEAANITTQNMKVNLDILKLPTGTVFGTQIHSIFEHFPFHEYNNDELLTQVITSEMKINEENIDEETELFVNNIKTVVRNTLQLELSNSISQNKFKLINLSPTSYLHELSFCFTLTQTNEFATSELINIFNSWGGIYQKSVAGLHGKKDKLEGFMIGFIDLVFEESGQYHIIDWKSNIIDPSGNISDEDIENEISSHAYSLQWAIYSVALHRHLSQTMGSEYDFNKHFGDVFYLFVRWGKYYHTRLTLEQILQLEKCLCGDN